MRKLVLILLVVPVALIAYLQRDGTPPPPAVPDYTPVEGAPTEEEIDAAFAKLLACHHSVAESCAVQSKDLRELIRFERRQSSNHGRHQGVVKYFHRLIKIIEAESNDNARYDLAMLLRNEVGLIPPILASRDAGLKILKAIQGPKSPRVAEILTWMLGGYIAHPDDQIRAGIKALLSTSKPEDKSHTITRKALFSRLEKDLAKMPEYVPVALEQLENGDGDLAVRRQIAAILHQAGGTKHRDKVIASLLQISHQTHSTEESTLRDMAIRSLARMGAVDTLPELLHLLDEDPEDLNLHRSMAVALPFFTQAEGASKYIDAVCNTAVHALKTDGLGKTAYKHAVRAIAHSGNPNAVEILRPFAMQQDRMIGPAARSAIRKLEKAKAAAE